MMEPHVPDVTTPAGLCDLMAVGNLCELGTILDRESYLEEPTADNVEEALVARWRYQQIALWFNRKYTVKIGESLV